MSKPLISIIVAIGKNRELGKNNKLLWHIPADMKRFKEKTRGHAVIMGRKTFESIGKPLANRTNIVITRNRLLHREGVIVAYSLEEAINIARKHEKEEIFIIGGAQIYSQAISLADKLYLTIVKGKYDADVFFPEYTQFKKIISEEVIEDGKVTYIEMERE